MYNDKQMVSIYGQTQDILMSKKIRKEYDSKDKYNLCCWLDRRSNQKELSL